MESSYSMVRCGDITKLIFVGTNQPRGVLIEKDEGCHILPLNNLISGIHDDRVNDQMNRINNFAVQESTCKTFVVAVPAYPSDITDFLVECKNIIDREINLFAKFSILVFVLNLS